MIGGLVIGLGGLVFPQALGVGYDTISGLLQGSVTTRVILGVLLVKWFIWAVSLGSGTSGGVLAPLLMMGGALGGLEAMFLPNEGGVLAIDQHGRGVGGHNAVTVHEYRICFRTDTRRQRVLAAAGRKRRRSCFHCSDFEEIDFD